MARPAAASAGTIHAYHGASEPIDAFRPFTHFGSSPDSCADRLRFTGHLPRRTGETVDDVMPGAMIYPVRLRLENPMEIKDLGNNSMVEIADFLERRHPDRFEGLTRKVAVAVAEADHRDPAGWTRLCNRLGLIEDRLVLSDQVRAQNDARKISPEAFIDAVWERYGVRENGPGWFVMNACFPEEGTSEQGRPQALVRQALQQLGHDGLIYANRFEDKGRPSYVVLWPHQVTFDIEQRGAEALAAEQGARRRTTIPETVEAIR